MITREGPMAAKFDLCPFPLADRCNASGHPVRHLAGVGKGGILHAIKVLSLNLCGGRLAGRSACDTNGHVGCFKRQ